MFWFLHTICRLLFFKRFNFHKILLFLTLYPTLYAFKRSMSIGLYRLSLKTTAYQRLKFAPCGPGSRADLSLKPAARARFSDSVYYARNPINSLKTPPLQPSHSKGFRGRQKISCIFGDKKHEKTTKNAKKRPTLTI